MHTQKPTDTLDGLGGATSNPESKSQNCGLTQVAELANFRSFSRLPPELRSKVWQHALLPFWRPRYYCWKSGLWQAQRHPSEDERGERERSNTVQFRHDKLELNIPLTYVNHEAREKTIIALRKDNRSSRHNRLHERSQRPYFVRTSDPQHDVLIVQDPALSESPPDFYEEVIDFDMEVYFGTNGSHHTYGSNIRHIARDELVLQDQHQRIRYGLARVFRFHTNIRVFYIVVSGGDDKASTPSLSHEIGPQVGVFLWEPDARRLRFESSGPASDIVLRSKSRLSPPCQCAEHRCEHCVHKLLDRTSKLVALALIEHGKIECFEMRIDLK